MGSPCCPCFGGGDVREVGVKPHHQTYMATEEAVDAADQQVLGWGVLIRGIVTNVNVKVAVTQ